jgi:DNA-binding CsgD family transcriptional regulator
VMYGVLANGRDAFAQLSLYRGLADSPFTRENADALRELLRYVAPALLRSTPPPSDAHDASVVVEEHLGIVGGDGTIVSAPDAWRRLLRLAALSEVSPRNAAKEGARVAGFLRQLCDESSRRREDGAHWQLRRQSPWGQFAMRTFRLPDARGRRADQIGLLIRREESRSIALVRGSGLSDLSPQQREVALLLAQGRSNPEIAGEMGLTLNTASYHVKQVYARLDVHERNAVAAKLLALAQAAAALASSRSGG